jgi:hypothetical protein
LVAAIAWIVASGSGMRAQIAAEIERIDANHPDNSECSQIAALYGFAQSAAVYAKPARGLLQGNQPFGFVHCFDSGRAPRRRIRS